METTPPNAGWWSAWAPFWEHLEDRHLSAFVAERYRKTLPEPILVVGAGQGLVVDHLRRKGMRVDGVDLNPEMIARARARRGVDLILADAAALPLADRTYRTTIIATGVVDYLDDEALIARVIEEAARVTRPRGELLVAFYRLSVERERLLRGMGIITGDAARARFRMARLFEIFRALERGPLACVPKIMKWTGRGALAASLFWVKAGLTVPAEMRAEGREMAALLSSAKAAGTDVEALFSRVPSSLPYRDEGEIARLLQGAGLTHFELTSFDDCVIARHRKLHAHPLAARATRPDSPFAIRATALEKAYPGARRKAVDGLSLRIEEGTIFGLLGPNGAGKTTTLSMLCGLTTPDRGAVEIAQAASLGDARRLLGVVPQDLALYPKLSALGNLLFFGRLYGMHGPALLRRARELLALVGLDDRSNDLVIEFSTGMMRRLNLAAGLVHSPRILLLDEPTVGIDPQSRNCIFDAVEELRARGVTVLYTTHYMEEASRLCDRIAVMDRGRIIMEDDPRAAVERYGHVRLAFDSPRGLDRGPFEGAIRSARAVEDAAATDGVLTVWARRDARPLEVVDDVRAAAAALGVELSLRSVVEPNLESLFLDLTGKSLRDEE